MKTAAISRFVIAAAVLVLISTPLFAQISFPDFSNTNNLTPNGSAAQVGNVLRLTADGTNHVTGTAWFNTRQPVTGAFSTTFSFQITHASQPADGIAFVIQNTADSSGLSAVGGSGGAIGYGNPDSGDIGTPISNSLAIEFDTYQNGWDPDANHVAVQSCGTGPNSQVHTAPGTGCTIGLASVPSDQTTLADGAVHTATITYTPPSSGTGPGLLDVILDGHDLFPGGLSFNWNTLTLTSGTAFVGLTGSVGGSSETNDILSWTFTPQQQSGGLAAGAPTPTVLNFSGGPTNGNNSNTGYEYDLKLDAQGNGNTNPAFATGSVTAIVMDQKSCNKLVQKKFPLTQCFVFQNADGKGNSGAVLFELTCPGLNGSTSSQCGDPNLTQFAAALGTSFTFQKSQNPGFQLLNSTIGPYPGWLKGTGPDDSHPCMPFPNNSSALFQSNQVSSFSVVGDPLGTTKGKSGGSGSCWVATYATTGELPPGIQISAPGFKTYTQNTNAAMQGAAVYTCSNPSTSFKDPTGATGPYLTVASCTQSQSPNKNNTSSCSPANGTPITCTGTFDISTKGLHLFTVTSRDSGGNLNANIVIYNVK